MSSKKKQNPYKKYCCVYGCMNKTNKDLTFYNVPKEMERRRVWLKAIDREDLLDEKKNKAKYNYVCSAHFEETDFIVTICKRLINDAVPTKLLPHQSTEDPSQPKTQSKERTRSSTKKNVSVSTYSHAQVQTETQTKNKPYDAKTEPTLDKPNIVFMNIEPEMAKPDVHINKPFNTNTSLTKIPQVSLTRINISEPTTSTHIQTEVNKNNNTKQTEGASNSTQTDTNESSIVLAPTSSSSTSSGQPPLKRNVKKEIEFVDCKQQTSEDVEKLQCDLESNNVFLLSDLDDEVTQRIRKLVEWQNKIKNKFSDNNAEYKSFALNLHYACPHAYRYLQTVLKLPNKSALHKFMFRIPSKLDDRVLYSLSLKIKYLPSVAKYCTISVANMALKRHLYYDVNKDEIIGFHNINGFISPEIARNSYVIMVQGIYSNWKQPLSYAYLGDSVHYAALDSWIKKVILKLFDIGLEVKAIISDQDSYFDKYAKVIKNVTVDEPYFFVEDHKIFYIFDVPNLLKCLRDDLLLNNFQFKKDQISWDHIKTLYEHQKDRKFMLIPKITDAHIEPNNDQKKSLKYAAEIFSNSVHAAMETYIDFGQITEEARGTANFIKVLDNLFDVLNSSKMKSVKKYQCSLTMSIDQEEILHDAQEMFKKIKSTSRETGKQNTGQITTFHNFQVTIQAVSQLFEDLKKENFEYLLTRRLTRDNLEIFFESIRKQCGSEPTPIKFAQAFSKLFFKNMLKSKQTDHDSDINDMLQLAENITERATTNTADVDKRSLVTLGNEIDHRMTLPNTNALAYVAGFLLFKCYKKHPNCKEFYRAFDCVAISNQPTFSNYKSYTKHNAFYDNLKMGPSLEMIDYVQRLDTTFARNFEHHLRERPGSEIFKILQIIDLPTFPCRCFPVDYLLKLFVRLRIYTTLKFNISKFRSEKRSSQQYLQVNTLQ